MTSKNSLQLISFVHFIADLGQSRIESHLVPAYDVHRSGTYEENN